MELANTLYNYDRLHSQGEESLSHKETIQAKIVEDSMCPLYELLCSKYNWQVDEALLKSMRFACFCKLIINL